MTDEEWRDVPDFEGLYKVSSLGRLKSFRGKAPRILAPTLNEEGYPIVQLCNHGRKMMKLHRVVALAFHPKGRNLLHSEVAHLDGDRANARADNLKWVSKVENHSHKRLHGTHQAGERHPRAKLTEAQVVSIRRDGRGYGLIAADYGVSWYTVSDIRRGRRWRHVA